MGCGSSASAAVGSSRSLQPTSPPIPQHKDSPKIMEESTAESDADKNGGALCHSPAPAQPVPVLIKSTSKQTVPPDQIVNKYLASEVKEELASMDIGKLQSESQERVRSLQLMTDYTGEEPLDNLLFLRAVTGSSISREKGAIIADNLSQWGFSSIFQQVWAQGFGSELYSPERKNVRLNMKFAMIIMWNSTDKSKELCKKCLDGLVYVDILRYLQDPLLDPNNADATNMYFIKGPDGNPAQHDTVSRPGGKGAVS